MIVRSLIMFVLLAGGPAMAGTDALESLSWLEGHWTSEAFGGTIEEVWLPASGDAMHGLFRLTVDGHMGFSEFLQVTAEGEQVIMRFKHFESDYSTWEGDGPPMELRLTKASSDQLVFEGTGGRSPSRIAYMMVGQELHVTVSGVDGVIRFQRLR